MHSAKNIAIIDANFILRYLLKDNETLYKEAEKVFEDVIAGKKKVLVLQSVLAEVVYVLQKLYKVERKEIADIISNLIKNRNFAVEDKKLVMLALDIFAKKNIDFVDCLLCAYGEKYEVLTFDRKLQKCIKSLRE